MGIWWGPWKLELALNFSTRIFHLLYTILKKQIIMWCRTQLGCAQYVTHTSWGWIWVFLVHKSVGVIFLEKTYLRQTDFLFKENKLFAIFPQGWHFCSNFWTKSEFWRSKQKAQTDAPTRLFSQKCLNLTLLQCLNPVYLRSESTG